MANILVIHGPNLNLLGQREVAIYGKQTLRELDEKLVKQATTAGHALRSVQKNSEGELIDVIHQTLHDNSDFLIINPAGLTHTSIALRDAIIAVNKPFIEVHISNIHARESFRTTSYFSDIAQGTICGLGPIGYTLALKAAIEQLTQSVTQQ